MDASRPESGRREGAGTGLIKLKGLGAAEDLNGFMDEGTEFLGELRFRDVLRIDGRLKGRIVSDNMLIVGESGHVEADIDCGVVSIRGTVLGRVHGRQRIELLAGSRVQATLVSPKLVIEDGAFFQGECEMGTAASGALPPRPVPTGGGLGHP
jgi:cytoskeletal protein CcmA (bactofilin family)